MRRGVEGVQRGVYWLSRRLFLLPSLGCMLLGSIKSGVRAMCSGPSRQISIPARLNTASYIRASLQANLPAIMQQALCQ